MRSTSLPLSPRVAGLVAALLSTSSPVGAQMWAGMGPRGVTSPAALGGPVATGPAPAAPAAPPIVPTTVLRHFPTPLDGWRIVGETGEMRWPVYLTPSQAAASLRVRVGYMSAVSILPETSALRLRINGHVVGTDPIDAPQGLRRIAFAIPADMLRPGFNEIAILVDQRHRVDCSVAATYELWTRLDPAETGLETPAAAAGIGDLADLPALSIRPDGSSPIHIVLSGRTNPPHLARLLRATQALALRGRMGQPLVDFSQDAREADGIDLALGTREALGKLPRLAGQLGESGPLATVLPSNANERPLVVVTGGDDREVDAAIAILSRPSEPTGSPAGLVAAASFPARASQGDEALTLHDLGAATQDFNGRSFKRSLAVALPADMFAADYGRATIDIAGGYASGLARGAQIRVDVNGRSSGIIKLPDQAGNVFQHNQLFLPLGLMKAGVNHIDVYAETPRAADASCAADPAKRFLLLDRSTLRLPTLARVERLPDLALATAGALPYTQGPAHLVVPQPDRDTMGAALSLTARMAVAAGRLVPFSFATKVSASAEGSTLIVAAAQSLDPATMIRVGLDPAKVESAWRPVAEGGVKPAPAESAGAVGTRWWLNNPDGPAACRIPTHGPSSITGAGDDLLDATAVEAAVSPLGERLATWAAALRSRFLPGEGLQEAHIDADTTLVMAQGVIDGAGDVTTIVTAPDAAMLRSGVGCLFDPQVWNKVHGRLASLDGSNGAVTAIDAKAFTYRGAVFAGLGNGRLILAGWFSLNPLAFVLMALLLAACLSGTTLWFVRGVGRRSE